MTENERHVCVLDDTLSRRSWIYGRVQLRCGALRQTTNFRHVMDSVAAPTGYGPSWNVSTSGVRILSGLSCWTQRRRLEPPSVTITNFTNNYVMAFHMDALCASSLRECAAAFLPVSPRRSSLPVPPER
jgi:hypothetical protein